MPSGWPFRVAHNPPCTSTSSCTKVLAIPRTDPGQPVAVPHSGQSVPSTAWPQRAHSTAQPDTWETSRSTVARSSVWPSEARASIRHSAGGGSVGDAGAARTTDSAVGASVRSSASALLSPRLSRPRLSRPRLSAGGLDVSNSAPGPGSLGRSGGRRTRNLLRIEAPRGARARDTVQDACARQNVIVDAPSCRIGPSQHDIREAQKPHHLRNAHDLARRATRRVEKAFNCANRTDLTAESHGRILRARRRKASGSGQWKCRPRYWRRTR